MGPQNAGGVVKVLLEQGDGLIESAGCLVGAGEIVARSQSVAVVGPQNTGAVFEVLLEQRDSPVESAGGLIGAGEIAA